MTKDVWTVQALYEHTDQRFDDLERSIERRFAAQDTATRLALEGSRQHATTLVVWMLGVVSVVSTVIATLELVLK